jgi:quercetin dioxygenase-like cupin family protein
LPLTATTTRETAAMTMPSPVERRQPASVELLTRLDLGRDFEALAGKELRLQLTTYAPGATGTPHSHEGRVEVVHVLSGAITEHHRDGRRVDYVAGDSFPANRDTFHHLQNFGAAPARLLVAMIADRAG